MALAALYHQSRAPTAYLSIYISRLGFSFEKVQVVLTDQFCQAKHREDKNSTYIYRQDMELFMTEISHVSIKKSKLSPSLTGQNNPKNIFSSVWISEC